MSSQYKAGEREAGPEWFTGLLGGVSSADSGQPWSVKFCWVQQVSPVKAAM